MLDIQFKVPYHIYIMLKSEVQNMTISNLIEQGLDISDVNEIRIAGRDYKRQSEFFDNQWSTTSNSVEFAFNGGGFYVDEMDIV